MKVKCIICEKIFASEGAHLQSFPDPNMYVCLLCSVKQESINATNQQG
jgi:DNA-directed RNA polymerase subunit RPC12/RpoP